MPTAPQVLCGALFKGGHPMEKIIVAAILGAIAVICFIISYRQFHEKGFLFNNAYIYAPKKERETMDKAPQYRQSGIVFALIGLVFLINALVLIYPVRWLFWLVIGIIAITLVYAVASSVIIEKRKKTK